MNRNAGHSPIIILGAPRSGTSLVHRILRGVSGCGAVAGESQHIWRQYTHPALFDWVGESWDPDQVTEAECERIRRLFRQDMLPASDWRRFDAADVMGRKRRMRLPRWVLRGGYRAVVTARRLSTRADGLRLVDKCVHAGLWPGLVHRVFPQARFVHVMREPHAAIESIRRGWLTPGRFRAFDPPVSLLLPDCDETAWNFPMPAGWRDYVESPVRDVAAFQWCRIQQGILDFAEQSGPPCIRIGLEALAHDPARQLWRLAEHLDLQWDKQLESMAHGLPRVNSSDQTPSEPQSELPLRPDLAAEVDGVGKQLGY